MVPPVDFGGTAMPPQELLLWVFCLIDDELQALKLPKLRGRPAAPQLREFQGLEFVVDEAEYPEQEFLRGHGGSSEVDGWHHRSTRNRLPPQITCTSRWLPSAAPPGLKAVGTPMNPVVGIGELLWDVYPDGRKVAGGAPFNFAFHCHRLGHPAAIVSRVGGDDLGRELREEVRRLGLSDECIQTDSEHPTGTVRVAVDENGQPAYTITQDVAWDYIAWDDTIKGLLSQAGGVCFGTLAQR